MTKTWLGLSMVGGSVLMLVPPAWPDYQAGAEAYKRGDYNTAVKEFRPLADQGIAVAQYNLGLMSYQGQGMPRDYQEAAQWCRLAAVQGHAGAQVLLGTMYHLGQGVPRDDVLAHMWVTLAAAQGLKIAIRDQYVLESFMTPEQLAQAQRLAREWKAKGKK